MQGLHPILTCAQAMDFEHVLLKGDEAKVWEAIKAVGTALGDQIHSIYGAYCAKDPDSAALVILGKGHNAADALYALYRMLSLGHEISAEILLAESRSDLKLLPTRVLDNLVHSYGKFIRVHELATLDHSLIHNRRWAFTLDGLLGMQFKPPLREPYREIIEWVNGLGDRAGVRISVDLPSGTGDESDALAFTADYTFATGIAKWPLFKLENTKYTGRIRYLDIGFFDKTSESLPDISSYILSKQILRPLRKLRNPYSDKRHYGHLLLIGGSLDMPGAVLMAAKAALQSGVGLVTVAVPEPLALRLAPAIPEAMWVPLPINREGKIKADDAARSIRQYFDKATALLMGPGMDTDNETQRFLSRILRVTDMPHVLDASALQNDVVLAASNAAGQTVITPHAGEFRRLFEMDDTLLSDEALRTLSLRQRMCIALKGPVTRVSSSDTTARCLFGGPVLARGGSGDILAGIIGSLLARPDADGFEAACMGVTWHGRAADQLAACSNENAVKTTDLLDHLSAALL